MNVLIFKYENDFTGGISSLVSAESRCGVLPIPGFVRELYECILRTQDTKECEQIPYVTFAMNHVLFACSLGCFDSLLSPDAK